VLASTGAVTLQGNTITSLPCVIGDTASTQVAPTPSGPVSAGDGSTSGAISNVAYVVAGALALAGFGGAAVLAVRRRRQDA